MSSTVHVAVATDMTYLPWCATAVRSCLEATTAEVGVHLLHPGDLNRDVERSFDTLVRQLGGQLHCYNIDLHRLAALPSKGPNRGGYTSWLRVLLPELLPHVDRVIYIDADTLTVDSLTSLWDLPLDGAPVAAVANVVEPAMHEHLSRLGFDDPTSYFNAGVLVMNLLLMREEGTLDRIEEYVARWREELDWFDQDALNAVFAGRWLALEPRWNAQNSFWFWHEWADAVLGADAVKRATEHPAILHFEGPAFVKPWHYLCRHPFADRYRRTLAATPWGDQPLEDRTAMTRVIRHLPKSVQWDAYARLCARRSRRGDVIAT